MMAMTIDTTDTSRALVRHAASGELYVTETASVWDGEKCVGGKIILGVGPIAARDLGIEGPIQPSPELFDAIDDVEMSDEDVDWLNTEDEAGRLLYVIGARV